MPHYIDSFRCSSFLLKGYAVYMGIALRTYLNVFVNEYVILVNDLLDGVELEKSTDRSPWL